MNCVTVELAQAFADLCVGTWNYYAVQQADGSYRPSYGRLTLSRMLDHLMGRYTLGTYVVDAAGLCSFAVVDADSDEGLAKLTGLVGELRRCGISCVIEASRRGWHVWVFFEQPTPAALVRAWLLPSARAYGVELYPKQDALRPGGVGSLIRLPLGVHQKSGGWYPFVTLAPDGVLVPVGETVAACCAWLVAHARRVVVPRTVVAAWEAEQRAKASLAEMGAPVQQGRIREWCCSQDIVEVIGRYTDLDRRGVGRCPLPDHHYRGDVRPSLHVFGGDDPHWYCYTWGRAGDVFDFVRLYYGLSVQEAWERLKAGTLL